MGSFVVTYRPDGAIGLVMKVVQNGRGPHVEATLRLATDGTIAHLSATGHHTFGTRITESFTRTGNRVAWKSVEEQGEQEARGPAFFLPGAELEMLGFLVQAARKAGGTIDLLPAGRANIASVGTLEVSARGTKRTISGYAIRGLELMPTYAWFDERGELFGEFRPEDWMTSFVVEGWEAVVGDVVAHQRKLDRAAAAQLAGSARHVPPIAGLALTHATVLDVVKGTWLADQTIVIVGDTIRAIGKNVGIPQGADVIDLTGKRVIPGLVDMHAHLTPSDGVLDLACGVTTVRDVGNDPDVLDELQRAFDAGTMVGPSVVKMGFIEGRNEKAASAKVTAETVDEAKAGVEFFAKRGYAGIKIYNSVKVELVPVLAAEAHKRGMLVIGHVPVHMLANEAVRAGYDGIEHINQVMLNFFATHETDTRDLTRFTLVFDNMATFDLESKEMGSLLQLFRDKKTVIDPTFSFFEPMVGEPGKLSAELGAVVARMPAQVQRGFLTAALPADTNRRATFKKSWDRMLAVAKVMWQARVHLVAGTDNIGGLLLHHELALLVQAGIPNVDVLRIATIEGARGMKLDGKLGSVSVGKRADLAILSGDPLGDITQLRTIERTVRAGVVYTSAPLFASVGVQP